MLYIDLTNKYLNNISVKINLINQLYDFMDTIDRDFKTEFFEYVL